MNRTTSAIHTFRLPPFTAMLAALPLLLLAPVAPAGANAGTDNPAPDLGGCPKLQVPAGNELAFHVYADGWQIYRWDGKTWSFVSPVAVLFADAAEANPVGLHFAGPSWQNLDGSKAVGMVMERCTPDPNAIPWLLLGAASSAGSGTLDGVNYVQRVNTAGGMAPTTPGASEGEVVRVPYTAEYFFYRAHP